MKDKYKIITDYIEIFENEAAFGTWIFDDSGQKIMKAPYQKYSDSVNNFIKDFISLKISDNDYADNVVDIELDQEKDYYGHLSEQDCITVLTTFIRRERFGQGFLVNALKNGNIVKVLKRLKEFN